MYVGHFAIGLAVKARYPDLPALPIMLGVGFLDVLDGILIIAGLDRVTILSHTGFLCLVYLCSARCEFVVVELVARSAFRSVVTLAIANADCGETQ